MEKIRAILHGGNLPLRLWAEVFDTVRYLYTLGPMKGIADGMTPEAIFYKYRDGERTSVKYLRVIGCTAYIHIPDKLRTKLDVKSKKCILVRYGTLQKGYRVWDPIKDTVIVSRDVIFDETKIGLEGNNECDRRPLLEDVTELEFEIEKIIKERIYNGEYKYYVKWVGYSDSENTWESYENMRDTKALDEWEERQNSDNMLVAEILEGQYDIDLISIEDVLSRPDKDKWIEAMAEEFELLKENGT